MIFARRSARVERVELITSRVRRAGLTGRIAGGRRRNRFELSIGEINDRRTASPVKRRIMSAGIFRNYDLARIARYRLAGRLFPRAAREEEGGERERERIASLPYRSGELMASARAYSVSRVISND